MSQAEIERIEALAAAMRRAFEVANPPRLIDTLKSFPHGACGDSALLLAHLLGEQGCGEFDYMVGEREGRTHAWLQRGPLIIDITADQFEDGMLPVFVSTSSEWHETFNGTRKDAANLSMFQGDWEGTLLRQYSYLSQFLPAQLVPSETSRAVTVPPTV